MRQFLNRLLLPRMTFVGYLIATVPLLPFWILCSRISTQRGYPPGDPYIEFIVPYLFLLLPAFFSLFDDRSKPRRNQQLAFSIGSCFGFAAVMSYSFGGHAVPNHGPYAIEVILGGAFLVPFIFIFSRCLDHLCESIWQRLRVLPIDRDETICEHCGYDLRGTLAADRSECPECGSVLPEQKPQQVKTGSSPIP